MLKISTSAAAIAVSLLASHAAVAQTVPVAPDASAAGIGSAANQPPQGTQTEAPAASAGDEVIVTGTRTTGLRASDSPAPIQVLGADTLKRVGQTDLMQALAQTLPQIQVQAFGSDQAAFHPQIKLRGLSPNQTLILVDGKRRHGTANVVVSGGISSGGASPDIGLIPEDAIDHVEVLQDGASAQYGTDAIAGVVNFILKKNDHGGMVNATVGQYEDGDGLTWDISGNIGIAPIPDSYLSVTAERKFHDYSFRGDVDPRFSNTTVASVATLLNRFPGVTSFPNYPYVNRIVGDGKYNLTNAMFNAGYTGISNVELYSFGSYSRRVGATNQNYRGPNIVYGKSAVIAPAAGVAPSGDIPYLSGFSPQEVLRETDYAATGGVKGEIAGTTYDLSTTYGRDFDAIYVQNSANAALYYDSSGYQLSTATNGSAAGSTCVAGTTNCTYHNGYSPTNVLDGNFVNQQLTMNADFTHKFQVGFAEPITLAGGLEYRHEKYQLQAGDPASYYIGSGILQGGIQSFFGYAPFNASSHQRHDVSEYLDISVKPVEAWLIDGAVRHENYSDFGSTTVFKVTSRYDFSPAFAVRGTVSTGFRAPTLAEEYYSGTNVSVSSLGYVAAPNSPAAAALGVSGLGPEKSTNFSFGVVSHPISRLTTTLDLYAIYLRNRIVASNSFTGYSQNCKYLPTGYTSASATAASYAAFLAAGGACTGFISPAVLGVLAANGVPIQPVIGAINGGQSGSLTITTFVNGVNTVTHGADFLTTYASDIGPAKVDWSLAVNYNYTRASRVAPPPPNVNQQQALLDLSAVTTLIDTTPKFRVTGGALASIGRFDINLRESFYGPTYYEATEQNNGAHYIDIPIHSAFITDIEITAKIGGMLRISVGANNVFNHYPSKIPGFQRAEQYAAISTGYITQYPSTSPFGINGGYYYGRIGVKF